MEFQKEGYSQHISRQFNEELEEVRSHLLDMGGLVEKQARTALKSLIEADSEQAQAVVAQDVAINQMEIAIDEECANILALRHPAASDLRLVLAITKAVNDLERIGDESAKIAKLAIKLCEEGEAPRGYVEIRHIGNRVISMTQTALTAFARMDAETALEVAHEDKSVDLEYSSATRELVTFMMEDPRTISRVLNIMWALRALERIGDHARNIAEDVIYLVKGQDVRHISIQEMEQCVRDS